MCSPQYPWALGIHIRHTTHAHVINTKCKTVTPQIKGIHRDTLAVHPWFISHTKGTSIDHRVTLPGHIWMYTGVHLNVSRKVIPLNSLIYPFIWSLYPLLKASYIYSQGWNILLCMGFRKLSCLRFCVFIIKYKTFDCVNQNVHWTLLYT